MDQNQKEAALEKIKKLLRMGADARGNPNEVAMALEKAVQTAKKYEIDLDKLLESGSVEDEFITKEVVIGPYLDPQVQFICEVLQDFFHVETFYQERGNNKNIIGIYGLEHHVEFAEYVFGYLRERSNKAWQQGRREYMAGYFRGVSANLQVLVESEDPDFFDPQKGSEEEPEEDFEEFRLSIHKVDNARAKAFEEKFRISEEIRPVSVDMDAVAARMGTREGSGVRIHRALDSEE